MGQNIENTNNGGGPGTIKLVEQCYSQSEAIIKHAEARRRPLSEEDLKQLKDLAKIIRDLGKVIKPGEVIRRTKIILARDPPGLL